VSLFVVRCGEGAECTGLCGSFAYRCPSHVSSAIITYHVLDFKLTSNGSHDSSINSTSAPAHATTGAHQHEPQVPSFERAPRSLAGLRLQAKPSLQSELPNECSETLPPAAVLCCGRMLPT
jgi:hypothetical protein